MKTEWKPQKPSTNCTRKLSNYELQSLQTSETNMPCATKYENTAGSLTDIKDSNYFRQVLDDMFNKFPNLIKHCVRQRDGSYDPLVTSLIKHL